MHREPHLSHWMSRLMTGRAEAEATLRISCTHAENPYKGLSWEVLVSIFALGQGRRPGPLKTAIADNSLRTCFLKSRSSALLCIQASPSS